MIAVRRRGLLAGIGALAWTGRRAAAAEVAEIRMMSDPGGTKVWFDPAGLLLRPNQTVRWTCVANYHTTAAYAPANDKHSLRIPEAAKPWASDVLAPGEHFEVTLTEEGVYDYYCAPHEAAGMVGRLIVGRATGPGSLGFDWFKGRPEARDWLPVPPVAQKAFPAISLILSQGSVPGHPAAMGAAMRHVPASPMTRRS